MKLLFRQRIFSWLDSYDIYNEKGETLFVVRGQLSWGHCLKIYDAFGEEVGKVKRKNIEGRAVLRIYPFNKFGTFR